MRKRAVSATIGSILYMGLGQLINGEWVKGILMGLYHYLILKFALPALRHTWWGLITLGEIPRRDHSIILLSYGLVGTIVTVIVIGFYIGNIVDAYRGGKRRDGGHPAPPIRETMTEVIQKSYPYFLVAPAVLFILFTVLFPMLFNMSMAFTNYDLYNSPPAKLVRWVGFENFREIVRLASWKRTFVGVLSWTFLWAILSTFSCFLLGLFLAIVLNNPRIKFRGIIRTILILPWAMPGFISILMWSGFFNTSFGPINQWLNTLGIASIPWFQNVFWARTAVVLVNLWLGFPFSMALVSGVIQGIPAELHDAAKVDGASPWQEFTRITLPLILYAVSPLLIMQFAGNFNNFGVVYLLTGGGPPVLGNKGAGGTDILISWIFKMTFDLMKYNYASAIALLIFIFVASMSIVNFMQTRAFKEEDMMG